VFRADTSKANGTAVIICPGGGFHMLAAAHEGSEVAQWLASKGITCFVLRYRLVHVLSEDPWKEMREKQPSGKFQLDADAIIPLAVTDGREALKYVRAHASDYKIASNKIGIMGFSAGGTVAAAAAFDFTADNRPDFVAPIYAFMPDSLQGTVTVDAPPMFLTVATNDGVGLALHSLSLYNKWYAAKRPVELHMYAKGGHGFGLRMQNLPTDTWIERFYSWLGVEGFLKKE
jgi:acetyl esterase/lipase